MSGHSKWATTKRQKAVVDAKRGAAFTKIGNLIAIAARKGTDPVANPTLAMAIEKAKQINMPKANIEKAVARVADKNAAVLEEITYEAYGPNGAAMIIEVATDNRNRTLPEIKSTLNKHGGRLADAGSVLFQFDQKGVLELEKASESQMLAALDAGADDVTEENDQMVVYTQAKDLMSVRQALIDAGAKVISAELEYIAKQPLKLDSDNQEKMMNLMNLIDDLDDTVNVHTNVVFE